MSDDFQTAFSSVLETKEEEANGNTPTPPEPKQASTEEAKPDPISSLEEKQAEARAKWKYEKRIKELEQQLAEKAKSGSINPESDNPIKDLKKAKGWSHDDIVNKALEALEDEGMTKEEAKEEVKGMSYEEIVAKVKEDLKQEQEKQTLEVAEKQKVEKAVTEFKGNIKKFAQENAEKFPLVDALGVTDNVYSMIEQDYLSKEDEFGTEYALKNMMKIEDAVKKVNETLATEIKTALKSDHVKKFLTQLLKEGQSSNPSEENSQLEDEFATLTNDSYRKVTDPKDHRDMSNEEALAAAFNYL